MCQAQSVDSRNLQIAQRVLQRDFIVACKECYLVLILFLNFVAMLYIIKFYDFYFGHYY